MRRDGGDGWSEVDWDWCITLRDERVTEWPVWGPRWCFHTATRWDEAWWHCMVIKCDILNWHSPKLAVTQWFHYSQIFNFADRCAPQSCLLSVGPLGREVEAFWIFHTGGTALVLKLWFIQYVDTLLHVWLYTSFSLMQQRFWPHSYLIRMNIGKNMTFRNPFRNPRCMHQFRFCSYLFHVWTEHIQTNDTLKENQNEDAIILYRAQRAHRIFWWLKKTKPTMAASRSRLWRQNLMFPKTTALARI